jgi:hypothetical protein
MSFAEKLLYCIDCKKPFTFTIEEQEFHSLRGFPNDPARCPACRKGRKTYRPSNEDNARATTRSDTYFR